MGFSGMLLARNEICCEAFKDGRGIEKRLHQDKASTFAEALMIAARTVRKILEESQTSLLTAPNWGRRTAFNQWGVKS